jgi:hypothetical protein
VNKQIIERIQTILREEGFGRFSIQAGAHSMTLSAEQSNIRAVFHLTDQEARPSASGQNIDIPAVTEVRVKASLPGAATSYNQSGRFGAGGEPAEQEPVAGTQPVLAKSISSGRISSTKLRDDRTRG